MSSSHRFHFFRTGGVDQVSLRDGKDLLALRELDRKLWVALAMPVAFNDIDQATFALIDTSSDGRIRIEDILDAIAWIERTFKKPDDLIRSKDSIALDALKDEKVVAAARRRSVRRQAHTVAPLGVPDRPSDARGHLVRRQARPVPAQGDQVDRSPR